MANPWDDDEIISPAPARARTPNQTFHNPPVMPSSLDVRGLYGQFQQQFPNARVTSTVRTPGQNASLPNAADNSFHLTGEAWDAVPGTPDEEQALVNWGTQNGFQVEVERVPYHVHFEPPVRGITTSTLGGSGGAGGAGGNPWDDDEIIEPATAESSGASDSPYGGLPEGATPILDADVPGGLWGYETADGRTVPLNEPAPAPAKPSLFRSDSDFFDQVPNDSDNALGYVANAIVTPAVAAAKDMFAGHESAAKYLAEKVGGTVGRDADGEPVVVLPDGTRYRVNDAGFDPVDAANIAGNAAAFYVPASAAANLARARQVGTLGRAGLQAVTAATTDATLQAAVNGGEIDGGRVAASGVGGGAGEIAGTAIAAGGQRAAPLVRRATGAAAREAREFAQRTGISAPTREQVNAFAQSAEQLRAGADPRALVGENVYGLQYTQGQRILEPANKFAQLSREELLRQTPGGRPAFDAVERSNAERVGNSLASMGENLGGKIGATPAELAQGAASRLREQADELGGRITQAYERAGDGGRTAIDAEAVRGLPDRLRNATRDFGLNPKITPAASETLAEMSRATKGLMDSVPGGRVSGVTLKALETQRRILNSRINAAANPTDRAALTAMKREFDGWLDESIDGALVSGDPGALQALKEARALRAEFGRRFEGKADTDRFIGGLLDGTRTPEELVNIALGAAQVSRAGGARFVQRLKDAAGNDPEVLGQLRAAHFLRMTQNTRGETVDFGRLISNIKATENSNGSIIRALYSPQEWGEIRRLADALEPLVAKGDFAKSSGSAERMARMLFQRTAGGLPLGVGDFITNFREGINAVRASSAVNAPLRLRAIAPPIAPTTGAAGMTEVAR